LTNILELLWRQNTGSGRTIILLIVALGVIGSLCALAHWRRYRDTETGWLENVRGRLQRARDAHQGAVTAAAAAESGQGAVTETESPSPHLTPQIELREVGEGIPRDSLIGDRIETILRLRQARVQVNVDALQQSSILKESAKWTLSFPGYVVSLVMMLGLLGTFVGLSLMVADIQQALPDPSAQANATQWADSVSSLGRILAGKKTAFSATLAGLFFSIVVSVFNFILARSQSEFYDRLERFTTEDMLPAAFVATDDETPWEKLSRQLGDSFENLQSLATAQARSAEQMAAVETTFGAVIANIEVMTQRAATAPLQGVTGEMTSIIGQLAHVNSAVIALTERLPQIVTSFRQTHQATLQEIQSAMQAQQGSLERLTRVLQTSQGHAGRWTLSFVAAGGAVVVILVLLLQRMM
jgi:hypothetical protein